MRCERFALTGDPGAAAERIRALVPTSASVQSAVAEIIAQVRNGHDEAVVDYTRRFDTGGTEPRPLEVEEGVSRRALERLDAAVRTGLERAIENVGAVAADAAAQLGERIGVSLGAHEVTLRSAPVDRAAVYVPGGRAPYPSTVVMGVVTARAAGVEDIAVCAPPGNDGELHPTILAACALTGATRVYRMGGAQAIAALAYGTETVARVDVIVGPGNLYVQEAKRQLSGVVGIDGFAGPSDLLLIADGNGAEMRTPWPSTCSPRPSTARGRSSSPPRRTRGCSTPSPPASPAPPTPVPPPRSSTPGDRRGGRARPGVRA